VVTLKTGGFKMDAFNQPFNQPSKGRIVNYHCLEGERYLAGDGSLILPAIITAVLEGSAKGVNLIVFTNNPSMPITMRSSVAYGMTNGGGWTWPEMIKVDKVDKKLPLIAETIANPNAEVAKNG